MAYIALPATVARPEPFAVLTASAAVLLAVSLIWATVDARLLDGVPVWMKPAKFSLSFVVHFGTLALIVRSLSPQIRAGRGIRIAGAVMGTAFLAEMAYLFFQAAQAEPSHFNFSTPFHMAMYQLMGVGAVLLIAMPLVVARAARRDPALPAGVREGIWLGALLSFGLTLVVAGYMSNSTGHFVGTPSPDTPVLPLVGWSGEVGDLRPAHFLSLHAFQLIPLAALVLARLGIVLTGARAWTLGLAYAALTLAVFAQALAGLPLIRL